MPPSDLYGRSSGRYRPTGNYECDDCGKPFVTSEAINGHYSSTDCTRDDGGGEHDG